METFEAITSRRSVRQYSGAAIPDESLKKILCAGLLAPSSRGQKPCQFAVVRSREMLTQLSRAKAAGAGMLAECDAAIVVMADAQKADTWLEDSAIAIAYMDLMAADLGIGSCWCQICMRRAKDGTPAEDNVKELLSLPDPYRVAAILALGMPRTRLPGHPAEEADFSRVHLY